MMFSIQILEKINIGEYVSYKAFNLVTRQILYPNDKSDNFISNSKYQFKIKKIFKPKMNYYSKKLYNKNMC